MCHRKNLLGWEKNSKDHTELHTKTTFSHLGEPLYTNQLKRLFHTTCFTLLIIHPQLTINPGYWYADVSYSTFLDPGLTFFCIFVVSVSLIGQTQHKTCLYKHCKSCANHVSEQGFLNPRVKSPLLKCPGRKFVLTWIYHIYIQNFA